MKVLRIVFITGVVFNLFLGILFAEDIQLRIEVDHNVLSLGASTNLKLVIHGVDNAQPFRLPDVKDLDIQYRGPSYQTSIVNGVKRTAVSFNYRITPRKTGNITFPALRWSYQGQDYVTDPIGIKVGDESDGEIRLEDKLYMQMNVDKMQVYVNEGVQLKLTLFAMEISVQSVSFPTIDIPGVLVENFAQPKQGSLLRNGRPVDVVEFTTMIYPIRSGSVVIDASEIKVSFEVASQKKKFINSVFPDSVLNDFFGKSTQEMVVRSNELVLKVLDIPHKGKPKDFSGSVGDFDLDVDISPTDLNVGDPITVRVKVKGNGNLKAVTMPEYSNSKYFKVYDPVIKEENGVKVLEQVLIPRSSKAKYVPEIKLSYFNVHKKRYENLVKEKTAINVKKGNGEDFVAVGLSEKEDFIEIEEPEELGEDIVFIKDRVGSTSPKGSYLYKNPVLYIFVGMLLMICCVMRRVLRRKLKFETDSSYARKMNASLYVQKGLIQLEQYLSQNAVKEFYNCLFKILQRYLVDKLGVAIGLISEQTVDTDKAVSSLPNKVKVLIKKIIKKSDMVRFAESYSDKRSMEESFKDFKKIFEFMEQSNE